MNLPPGSVCNKLLQGMKKKSLFMLTVAIFLTFLFLHSCRKEDSSPKEIATSNMLGDISADSLRLYVQWMEGMGTRFCLARNHRDVAVKLKNKFINMGYTEARLDSFLVSGTFRGTYNYNQLQYNVIASLEGSENPDSICIIGAHYDNILSPYEGDPFALAYGANDNASGVAAVIEIARVMKKNNYEPRNTILFMAFDAEEIGLKGSYAWSNNAKTNNAKIKMMLNNDMIAYQPPAAISATWAVDIMNYPNSQELMAKAQQMTNKYTVINYVNDNTFNRQSDSYPFSQNNYPAVFFYGYSSDPNYHTLGDVSAKCNFDFCVEIVKINCAVLVDANTSDN
jgi:Zn-dependent M28 family amino/carboxypeptidase